MATNKKIIFRDTAIHISSTADGDLSIAADDEIDLTSTLIDINGNVTISGTTGAAALTTSTIVASGIIKTDDTTAATSTTDGSLQTDGGLSVALDAVIGDDIIMLSDAAQIAFGTNSEITLAHVHNVGLTLTHVTAGDNLPVVLQLKSEEDVVVANEVIASIEFAAGDSDGTDGATVAAGIHAIAEDTFSASVNKTKLVFTTGVSETAASSATAKATLSSIGDFTVAGDLIIKDGGTIGSASDLDALSISSGGVVNFTARPTFAASLTIQDGGSLGSASDLNAMTISSGGVVAVTAATASTSATSGALTVGGGAGIAADLSVGDDLFMISDAAVVTFGANKDVTLTHVHDTGLLLNAAMAIQFRDSAINIGSPADGDLDINADDEIELNSTLIDINGALDVSGNSVLASVDVTGVATAATFEPDGDTSSGDNAAIGYTSAEGLILTGQGSTSDITLKNDADATVFTVPTGTDDILFPDSAKAMFGAGSDLQIYHDGSHSYIDDAGSGSLYLRSNNIRLNKYTGEQMINTSADGAVTLFYNNAAKLATAGTGVTMTGEVTATGFTGTLDGVLGGGTAAAATTTTLASTTITASGIIKTDDSTAATSTTDGSLQTDGGLSVVLDAVIGDDIIMISDAAQIAFGANSEIALTHVHNVGLQMTSTVYAPLSRRGEDVFIVLDGTNAASANAGDNVILDASAASTDVGDDIISEDEVFLHSGMQRNVINIRNSQGKILNSVAGFAPGAI